MKNKNYSVFKLRTGETLFAELVSSTDTTFSIINPWVVRGDDSDSLTLAEWMPFADTEVFTLPNNICYFASKMNKKFIKFYGSVILQSEINKIKEDVRETMDDRNDYLAMLDGVERMKEVTRKISKEFDLDSNVIDFSPFEEQLIKNKPNFH